MRIFRKKSNNTLQPNDDKANTNITGPKIIRDFIYLDIERIRSCVAQFYGGLTMELTSNKETKDAVSGSIKGGIPLSMNLSAGIEKYLLKSNQETKSLHDHIFNEFYQALSLSDSLTIIESDDFKWNEASFIDGSFYMVKGAIQLIDYKYITHMMSAFPSIANNLERVVFSSSGQNPKKQIDDARDIKRQVSQIPLKELVKLLEEFYGDTIKAKFFPFLNKHNQLFISSPDRTYFRYDPLSLMQIYSYLISAGWKAILQINRGIHSRAIEPPPNNEVSIEASIEQTVIALSDIHQSIQGIHFPAVSATTIAIFRETTLGR